MGVRVGTNSSRLGRLLRTLAMAGLALASSEAAAQSALDVQRIIPIHYPADNRNVSITELKRWVGQGN